MKRCAKEILVKASSSGSVLNLETKAQDKIKTLFEAGQNIEKVEANPDLKNNQNTGFVARLTTLRRIAMNQRRKLRTTLQML